MYFDVCVYLLVCVKFYQLSPFLLNPVAGNILFTHRVFV